MNSKKVLAELAKIQMELAELKAGLEELKKQRKAAPAQEAPPQYSQPMGPPPYNPYAQQGYPPQGYPQQGYPPQAQQFARSGPAEPPPGWQPRGEAPPMGGEAEEQRAKLDKPIDRNGVAPADVNIEKMFYFGNKKK